MSGLMISVVLLLAAITVAVTAQKDARFKTCKRNQPAAKLNECVRDAIQKAVPELVKGLPEYGLLTIDPLRVESLEVAKREKSAVSVDIKFKNLDISGLKNAKIKSANMDVNKHTMSAHLDIIGNVTLVGHYEIEGKVLVLPITGVGHCKIVLVNAKVEITEVKAKPVTKNGKEYAHVTSFKLKVTGVDKVHYHLENLFNGNKELGDNMNLVLNDNWKAVYDDMIGPVQDELAKKLQLILEKLLSKVPYNKIFP